MITRMRERMDAKCGNSNDNAFRIRKLFLAWDKGHNGMVHFEDLRQMCESFGMQLADDDLLALFCVYDPEGTGYLAYMDLVKHLMHPDTFRYFVGAVDNSQSAEDRKKVAGLLETVHKKFVPVVSELQPVLAAFDGEGSGFLSKSELLAGCASLGVVVSDSEFESLKSLLKVNDAGKIDFVHLCAIFA
jgi:Ca2+-binding EF-hand superfamily protein